MLAGHAYAGAVIGATRNEKVKALVYVAALAPDEGETVADVFYRATPHPQAPKLAPDSHGLIYLPEEAFAAAFAPNATGGERGAGGGPAADLARLHHRAMARPLWKDRPAWYLVAEQDRMIVQDNQRFMAQRMGASCARAPADHAPIVTAPAAVVDIIREAVAAGRSRAVTVIIALYRLTSTERKMTMTAIKYRTADVDGFNVFYREAGAPAAPKLLLLHGFPTSSHMFRDLIPLLADRFHIVAPDLPGFGSSDMPERGLHLRHDRRADRPLHRNRRLRPLRRLCLRLWRADRIPPRGEASRADHRDHLAERQRL